MTYGLLLISLDVCAKDMSTFDLALFLEVCGMNFGVSANISELPEDSCDSRSSDATNYGMLTYLD